MLPRSNGTGLAGVYVDGQPVRADKATRLLPGDRVVFGSLKDETGAPYTRFAYDVVSAEPRAPCAVVNLTVSKNGAARDDEDDDDWSDSELWSDVRLSAPAVDREALFRKHARVDSIYESTVGEVLCDGDDTQHKYNAFFHRDDQLEEPDVDHGVCDVISSAGCINLFSVTVDPPSPRR